MTPCSVVSSEVAAEISASSIFRMLLYLDNGGKIPHKRRFLTDYTASHSKTRHYYEKISSIRAIKINNKHQKNNIEPATKVLLCMLNSMMVGAQLFNTHFNIFFLSKPIFKIVFFFKSNP
jgi:hypothetical protein